LLLDFHGINAIVLRRLNLKDMLNLENNNKFGEDSDFPLFVIKIKKNLV